MSKVFSAEKEELKLRKNVVKRLRKLRRTHAYSNETLERLYAEAMAEAGYGSGKQTAGYGGSTGQRQESTSFFEFEKKRQKHGKDAAIPA